MTAFPAMPLWTDTYLADTASLSTIEHGALLLLLVAMWRAGGVLPDDDIKLARIARLGPQQWRRIRPIVMQFMVTKSGYITNEKLLDTLGAVKRRSKSAKNSANARWLKNKELRDAIASDPHMRSDANLKRSYLTTAERTPRTRLGEEEFPEASAELIRLSSRRGP